MNNNITSKVVIGIDPGTHRMGYGVILVEKNKIQYLDCGVIEIKENDYSKRLLTIHKELLIIFNKYKPQTVGIEKLFFANNKKTALSVAESRGIAILSIAEINAKMVEIAPTTIKQAITGYGKADKKAVTKMVKLILKLDQFKVLDDATDALGIAIAASYL